MNTYYYCTDEVKEKVATLKVKTVIHWHHGKFTSGEMSLCFGKCPEGSFESEK